MWDVGGLCLCQQGLQGFRGKESKRGAILENLRKRNSKERESTIFAKENNARTRRRGKGGEKLKTIKMQNNYRNKKAKKEDKERTEEKRFKPVLWDFLKLVNSRWHWAEQVR